MNEHAKRIQASIENVKRLVPGYFEKTVEQRSPRTGCGSIVTSYKGQVVVDGIGHLVFYDAANGWKPYPECPNLLPGCFAYRNDDIGGLLGIVELATLDPEEKVTLDDRKGTGTVSATIHGQRGKKVDFTVAIVGIEQGEEVLFTFHPGDPCHPSEVKTKPGLHGKTVTVAEAMALGLSTAKIV